MAMVSGGINAGDVTYHVGADLSGLQAGIQQSQQMVQGFGTTLVQNSRAVGVGFTAMGAAMVAPLALGIKTAADFDQAITNAASVTGKTGDEFEIAKEKMAALAQTLGETTVFSATEAANAFYDLSSKGFDVASMSVEELKPILDLAAATQSDLTLATETATSTLRAFGLENSDMARVADVMVKGIGSSAATIDKLANSMNYAAPVAKAAGVSVEELVGHLSQLYDAGLDGSMAGTALRGTLMELMSPSDTLQQKLESVGLTTDDVSLSSHSFNDVLKTLRDSGLSSADMLDVFGARAGPAALVLLETADSAGVLSEELNNAGGTAATVAEQQLDTLWGQLKLLTSALEALIIPIGQALIPALQSLAEFITPIVSSVAEFAKEHEFLTTAIIGVTGALGLFFLTIGPLMIMLPGLVLFFQGLSAILGIGGVATAATSASTAIAGVGTAAATAAGAGGIGALIASLAAIAWPVAAGAVIAAGLGAIAYSAMATREAFAQVEQTEQQVIDRNNEYIQSLIQRGIVLNEAAAAAMSHSELMLYAADAEKASADALARAWFEHFAGRTETEKEFGQMRALMLNESISAEEAAIAVSMGLSEEKVMALVRGNEQETESLLNELGIRQQAEQQAITEITDAEYSAANTRNNIWMEQTHSLVAFEQQKAQEVGSTWGSMLAEIARGIMALPIMAADALRNVVGMQPLGMPANAAGGPAYANAPTLVGERGPELFVPRVDGRIMTHTQTAAAMAGGGGGNVTVNMNANIASNMDIDAVAKRLGDQLRQRFTGIGHHADWRRA